MSTFIKGLELCHIFYVETVQGLIQTHFSGLPHSAARIGGGSEVLGFDTEMSTDHDWGPRLQIFLHEEDLPHYKDALDTLLRRALPPHVRGYSTHFNPPDETDNGTQTLGTAAEGAINHRVEITSPREFVQNYLTCDLSAPLTPADWLTFSEQKLLGVTKGAVYHDAVGLQTLRDTFAYYPQDIWLYQLASTWTRIGQEQHLMGRAGYVGDEIGSALIGARLVRDTMRLCFLMERQYAPYAKWLGTAFSKLPCAPTFTPLLRDALAATRWQEREQALCKAYTKLAEMHNALALTEPLPTETTSFFGRPFQVIFGNFSEAICEKITSPEVRKFTQKRLIGSVDTFSDSVDLVTDPAWRDALRSLYTA